MTSQEKCTMKTVAITIVISIVMVIVSCTAVDSLPERFWFFISMEVCHLYGWYLWYKNLNPQERRHRLNNSYPYKGIDKRIKNSVMDDCKGCKHGFN